MSKTKSDDKSLPNEYKTPILYHFQATIVGGHQQSGVVDAEDIVDAVDCIQTLVPSRDISSVKVWSQSHRENQIEIDKTEVDKTETEE
jgi:hypothetical protein